MDALSDADADADSDSGASHVSATPPSSPPTLRPSLRPHPHPHPHPHPRPRPRSHPKPKKPESKNPPPQPSPSAPPPFPSADLSDPHLLSVKIRRTSHPAATHAPSFSALFRSRRPSFDPSDLPSPSKQLHADAYDSKQDPSPPDLAGARPKPVRARPNWIGSNAPLEPPPSKRPRSAQEGNFVRLNINGRGRKFAFRNRVVPPRSSRYRRRRSRKIDKPGAGPGNGMGDCVFEEEGLVSDVPVKQRKSSKCGAELVEAVAAAARAQPSDENLRKLLKLTHGYDSFREGQLEAIKKVLAGESTMLVLPTGAGKSLCYQLPALILPGLTLVVSPLVALMVDQLRQLPSVIPGGLLSSSQTSEEASATLNMLCEGKIKVLFVSPERFLNSEFLSLFGDAPSISLVVVDEAHCLSEWSHNFRPSYLRLRRSLLRTKLDVTCFLAMTATATNQTLHDIMGALEIPHMNLIQACQIRKNLQLFVTLSENRLKDLLMLMKSSPLVDMRSIIVYCKFQAETDLLSKYLCDSNICAKVYHSGIPPKERSRIQELFCSNKIRVVVATVAFGMGLDKSDVEAVIHYSLPESLEEYIQETGRAGRDGRLSYCHLLLDYTTYFKLRSLSYGDGVDGYAINKLLSQIFSTDTPLGKICSLIKESASRRFDMKEEVLLTILTQLEVGDVQYLHLLPQAHVTCTLYFHKTTPALLADKNVIIATILKKSDMKHGYYVFDIPAIANNVGIKTTDLLNELKNLKSLGEITYDLKDPAFCFVVVKKLDDFCSLTTQLTNWLSDVESCKVKKLDSMFNAAIFAVKECKKADGCSDSMHSSCIQEKISDYFSREHNMHDAFPVKMGKSSPFLRADIKVFLQSNLQAKFTPRAVARIMHGIASPAFPAATWSKTHFWGRYSQIDFPVVMEAATLELMNFVRRGGA